jgi:LysR family transcriptional regulator, regulator of abg operon
VRLNQIRDFVATFDAGSIRAASRKLGVSQPGLTKSIRLLEEELGSTLIQRTSRGVTLTAAGRSFLIHARAVQGELARAREELDRIAGAAETHVTLGVAAVFGSALVPDALALYRRKRPQAGIRIIEGTQETLLPLLRDQTLDLAVCLRSQSEAAPSLKFRSLLRTRLVVVARQGHPRGSARSLAELHDAHWLMFRPRGGGGALEEAFARERLPMPHSVVHCESHGMALAILSSSDAVGLLAPQLLAMTPFRAALQQIPVECPMPLLTVGIFTRTETPSTPAAADLASALNASARGLRAASG